MSLHYTLKVSYQMGQLSPWCALQHENMQIVEVSVVDAIFAIGPLELLLPSLSCNLVAARLSNGG
jgi:hypothetical protein